MKRSSGWHRLRARSALSLCLALGLLLGIRGLSPVRASTLWLHVAYPGEADKLPYLTQSFVFGSTQPGSTVSVNGVPALVAATGGWIAFVPFGTGQFRLHVVATSGAESSSVDRTVSVASPLRTLSATPARIDAGVAPLPDEDMTLDQGDVVHLFVKASTAAHVWASLDGANANVPLVETTAPSLNPTDKARILGDAPIGGTGVGGIYAGDVRVPQSSSGKLSIVYTVTAADGSTAQATAKGSITVSAADSHRVGYVVLGDRSKDIDARPYGIVESEPDGGWLFFPPARTPFEVTGSDGAYYRVALGSTDQGWMAKTSLVLAKPGTPRPRASMQGVDVRDAPRTETVVIHLTARVPFWITESTDRPSLHVRIFGAVASTDLVRYGADRSNVSEVRWDQQSGGIATVDVALRQSALWGYHASWEGNDIKIAIKKPPLFKPAPASALSGLLIVIDPGHSPDSGAIGPLGTLERDVNLSIAKRLAARLEELGARTVLTRTANIAVGLYDRTALASRLGADVLISVHNNALPDGVNPFTHHGFSVYYYQPQSLELARSIHSAYQRDTDLPDYGLYYDNLALARPTEEPAVLTESAFIMWPPEEMKLRDPAFQETLARTIADGMNRWAATMRARKGR